MKKKILYIDMDDVLADYKTKAFELGYELNDAGKVKGFFKNLKPIEGAIEAVNKLLKYYDVYILSTPCWENNSSYSDKAQWIKTYFQDKLENRLILSYNKGLCKGDYLIDDRDANGVLDFEGEWIQYGSEKFPDWEAIVNYLIKDEKLLITTNFKIFECEI